MNSGSYVVNNLGELKNYILYLKKYQIELDKEKSIIFSYLISLSNHWNDINYERLSSRMSELNKVICDKIEQFKKVIRTLEIISNNMENYLKRRN